MVPTLAHNSHVFPPTTKLPLLYQHTCSKRNNSCTQSSYIDPNHRFNENLYEEVLDAANAAVE